MEKRVLAVYRKWRRMVSGSTIIVYICDFLDYGCQPLYDFDNANQMNFRFRGENSFSIFTFILSMKIFSALAEWIKKMCYGKNKEYNLEKQR